MPNEWNTLPAQTVLNISSLPNKMLKLYNCNCGNLAKELLEERSCMYRLVPGWRLTY